MKSNNVDKALIGMGCGFIIFLLVLATRWIRDIRVAKTNGKR